MIATALCLLALVDAAFSGFRAFAGRDGRVDKRGAKIAAAGVGAMTGVGALGLLAVVLLGTVAVGLTGLHDLEIAGRTMLGVYAVYATVIALGFVAYFSPSLEVQSLGTLLVLGPGTLVRPVVIVGGAVAAGWGREPVVMVCALVAAAVMLGVEPVLNRRFAARYRHHPFDSTADQGQST